MPAKMGAVFMSHMGKLRLRKKLIHVKWLMEFRT